ncbi:conserved hypothetical protein [metagenome]|uniref:4Fe-4S ferredoxin-type domain-containing protein n=1 Tax=metagenome TaxID=256318 RepID=A0A2P2C3W3_9ZZZZ
MTDDSTTHTGKVVVDRGRCTGIGICESIAPEVFEVDDDGELILLVDQVDLDDDDATTAVASCPAMALSLEG